MPPRLGAWQPERPLHGAGSPGGARESSPGRKPWGAHAIHALGGPCPGEAHAIHAPGRPTQSPTPDTQTNKNPGTDMKYRKRRREFIFVRKAPEVSVPRLANECNTWEVS